VARFDLATRFKALIAFGFIYFLMRWLRNDALESARNHEPRVTYSVYLTIFGPLILSLLVLTIFFANRWLGWINRNGQNRPVVFNLWGWLLFGTCMLIGIVQYLSLKQALAAYGYR
jgi:hypothetical protein